MLGLRIATMKYMTEEQYRIRMLLLSILLGIGILIIGWRISENGRYVQFDYQKNTVRTSDTSSQTYPTTFYDSRTGKVLDK